MQPKNLGWKFAFVGVLVALGLYSIWANELRQGIDLKGGHILTFEVEVGEKEKGQDVVRQVIDVLKQRVDPTGTASLEWRPVGTNRFEVRMPMGTEESRRAKEAFASALEVIEAGQVKRSDLLLLQRGQKTVAELARGDPARQAALERFLKAYKARERARAELERLRAGGRATEQELRRAQEASDNAAVAYDEAVEAVFRTNIHVEKLRSVLALYVPRAERKTMPRKRRERREKELRRQLEELRRQHPARRAEIDQAFQAYKNWAERRTRLDDPADLKRLVARAGVLEFRICPTIPGGQRGTELSPELHQRYHDQLAAEGPLAGRSRNEPFQWFPLRETEEDLPPDLIVDRYAGRKYILLYNQPGFTMLQKGKVGWSLTARPGGDDLGRPAVHFTLDARGAKLMGVMTGNHKGHFMAILLDDEVYSAPVIRATIYNRGIISGDFSRKEVSELARILNAGALRARVNPDPVSEKTIPPSMGEDNRKAGIRAAIWGLIFVAFFMLAYYLYAGAIADVALMLNLILVLGAMSFIEAVFTLPGVAGVILTIGMAVDANVLIFERLREEQAKTRSMRMAIRNAYANAASAILDGNATTLITCLILGWVGTEEVRGFAITLGLGVMFSLFTALVVTRWIFQLLAETGLVKRRIAMLAFIGTPKIDWMSKRRLFWAFSTVLVAAGLVALFSQGRDVLGLEFSSGTQAVFTLKPGVVIPDAAGREVPPDRARVEWAIRAAADRLSRQRLPQAQSRVGKLLEKVRAVEAQAEKFRAELEQAPAGRRREELAAKVSTAQRDLKKLRMELTQARRRVRALKQLPKTVKVETLIDRRKVAEALDRYDANGDGLIDRGEWAAKKAAAALFTFLDADGDKKLTRAELAQRLPERSYQASTTVADVGLLREVVQAAFGPRLEMSTSVKFELARAGTVPGLRLELDPADEGKTYISAELAEKVPPRLRARFIDMVGGVMFVLRNVSPALDEAELADRLATMRAQPDFAQLGFNRTDVVGLEVDPAGEGFSTLAVMVLNRDIDYYAARAEWDKFAADELGLVRAAMERQTTKQTLAEFDPAIAGRTSWRALFAFILSWLAIIAYLWLRFGSVRWGLAAVVCLVHDVLIAIGMVALSGYVAATPIGRALLIDVPFRIDMAVVAAFLTVIGYSVNDTIVVFDRIRENRGRLATVSAPIINKSINQTISRTLLTTFTTLLAVVTMYVAGGPGIRPFTYALLVGIIFGTYSSVAIASPLLLGFRRALLGRLVGQPAPARA